MGWKATSQEEAAAVLLKLARSGIRVLNELDYHVERHLASNDYKFNTDKPLDTGVCKESVNAFPSETEADNAATASNTMTLSATG